VEQEQQTEAGLLSLHLHAAPASGVFIGRQ
jgi:hypothetical protein